MSDKKSEDFYFSRIQGGDKLSFQEYFEANYPKMVNYAFRICRDETAAEEIVQEVFIYLWEKRQTIGITSSLDSYLFAATKNRCINFIKNELPKMQIKVDIEDSDLSIEYEEYDDEDETKVSEIVARAINNLPPKCKEIFLLSRTAGLTYEEISAELGISKKTVENQMTIALKKLREMLKPLLSKN